MISASDQIEAIHNGIDDLARSSCVKFRPYVKGDRDAVVIQVAINLTASKYFTAGLILLLYKKKNES